MFLDGGVKALILCADYPNLEGGKALSYVHVRNKYYKRYGITPVVLNFSSDNCYKIDDIDVITLKQFRKSKDSYDWLICHAPNIRNHYLFLRKYEVRFEKIAFIFHGHEIVKVNEVYPEPYDYMEKKGVLKHVFQGLYDTIKLKIWREYFPKLAWKAQFIFVSKSLYQDFCCFVHAALTDYVDHIHIIPNSIGEIFEKNTYDVLCKKEYDFITIRSNLDSSVYCIDLVTELAKKYSQFAFLVIGKGDWFRTNVKPENITLINDTLDHYQLLNYINQSKYALMPTRRDSQGVMTCELLTYGIPVITSNLKVCREICKGFSNYMLIENNVNRINLEEIIHGFKKEYISGGGGYFLHNTTMVEIQLLKNKRN